MDRQAGGWPAVPHDSGSPGLRLVYTLPGSPSRPTVTGSRLHGARVRWTALGAPLPLQQEERLGLKGASGLGESGLCPQRAVRGGSGLGKPAGTTPAPQSCRSLVLHWPMCHRVSHPASAAISPGFITEDASAPETRLSTSA